MVLLIVVASLYRADRGASFAVMCMTRRLSTALTTTRRGKLQLLTGAIGTSRPSRRGRTSATGQTPPGSRWHANSSPSCAPERCSALEREALAPHGLASQPALRMGVGTKQADNALQHAQARIERRRVPGVVMGAHQQLYGGAGVGGSSTRDALAPLQGGGLTRRAAAAVAPGR